jgi:hypothetical protein
MNHKHEALWPLKNFKLYILCILILFNSLHLTIGSRLILTQSELEFQNVVVQILNFFGLCLGQSKDAIKILTYCVQ